MNPESIVPAEVQDQQDVTPKPRPASEDPPSDAAPAKSPTSNGSGTPVAPPAVQLGTATAPQETAPQAPVPEETNPKETAPHAPAPNETEPNNAAPCAPVPKETPRKNQPLSFGARLKGTIAQITESDIEVDIEHQRRALIPRSQFDREIHQGFQGKPEVGQKVDIVLARGNGSNGHVHANLRGALIDPSRDPLTPDVFVEGKITGMIKGGLEVEIGKKRAFMPASHADTVRLKDISILLGETARCRILDVDAKAKSIVVSRKRALDVERAIKRKLLFDSLQVGDIRVGSVRSLVKYGVFVDLGGVQGLVHISDISWTPIASTADALKVRQEVQVKVLKINRERGKVALGIKQTMPNPWETVDSDFAPDTRVKGKVCRLADFGAFVELARGVNGLIPLAEMTWGSRPASPGDVVQVGQEVEIVVINVDAKRRRIGLSLKRITPDPWESVAEDFAANKTVSGKVSKILEFGALVELRPHVEGMIHISELSHERVRTTGDAVKVGEEVEVKVLSVDPRKRRIALSRKALLEPPVRQAEPASAPRPRRKRELRGGLDSHFQW